MVRIEITNGTKAPKEYIFNAFYPSLAARLETHSVERGLPPPFPKYCFIFGKNMKNNNNRDMDQNMGLKDFSHSLCSLEITYIQIFGGRGGEGRG